ncbi:MAG: hypothetical protein ING19_20810 [Azospirillum sp.]|nr:hypothetical protein [Azospirillum sp.]
MAIEGILVKDADGTTRLVLADKIGAGEEYAQVLKVGYGADGALTLLDEKPSTASGQDASNAALGAPDDAEATGNGTIIGVLKRARTLLGNIAAAVTGTLAVSLPDSQKSASGAVLIGNNKSKIRDEFPAGALDPALWETIATGAGMTVTVGNGATGSYLNIASGTTANSETLLRSVGMFTLPVRLAAFVTANQRIANCEFFIELIEVDPATGLPVTVATSQTNAGVWKNHAAIKFDGTVATEARVSVRSGGAPEFQSAASTITTTVATGTDPNFFPAGFVELQASGEHVSLFQGAVDTQAAAGGARRVTQAAPNPDAVYKLQLRVRNLATAPLTSTSWRVHAIRLFDYTRLTAEVIGGPGHSTAGMSVPVNVAGGALTANASTNRIGNVAAAGIWWDDTSTALAANATFTGTARDLTVTATATAFANAATYAQEYVTSAETDQAGTLWLEVSRDGTTWRRVKSVATVAVPGGGQYAEIVHRPSWRHARTGFTNGATAQTRLTIGTIAKAN